MYNVITHWHLSTYHIPRCFLRDQEPLPLPQYPFDGALFVGGDGAHKVGLLVGVLVRVQPEVDDPS